MFVLFFFHKKGDWIVRATRKVLNLGQFLNRLSNCWDKASSCWIKCVFVFGLILSVCSSSKFNNKGVSKRWSCFSLFCYVFKELSRFGHYAHPNQTLWKLIFGHHFLQSFRGQPLLVIITRMVMGKYNNRQFLRHCLRPSLNNLMNFWVLVFN